MSVLEGVLAVTRLVLCLLSFVAAIVGWAVLYSFYPPVLLGVMTFLMSIYMAISDVPRLREVEIIRRITSPIASFMAKGIFLIVLGLFSFRDVHGTPEAFDGSVYTIVVASFDMIAGVAHIVLFFVLGKHREDSSSASSSAPAYPSDQFGPGAYDNAAHYDTHYPPAAGDNSA